MCPLEIQGGFGSYSGYAPATQLQRCVISLGVSRTNGTGYRFKSFDAARAMASANPNEVSWPELRTSTSADHQDLKSPEELEEEDRAAKSAKLQELIRRGNPRDLAAAQELMKYLAGAVSCLVQCKRSQLTGRNQKRRSTTPHKRSTNWIKSNRKLFSLMTCSITPAKARRSGSRETRMNKWHRLVGVLGQRSRNGSRKIPERGII
jgi:hypothetical protein